MFTILKGIFYFFKYTLPIQFVALAIYIGMLAGTGTNINKYSNWKYDTKSSYTHQVTIFWDEGQSNYSDISVREDINWSINGMCDKCRDGLYSSCGHIYNITLPAKANRNGYVFCGLGTSPYGGEMYVNAAGYAIKQVTEDLQLYAVWEKK